METSLQDRKTERVKGQAHSGPLLVPQKLTQDLRRTVRIPSEGRTSSELGTSHWAPPLKDLSLPSVTTLRTKALAGIYLLETTHVIL